MKLIVSQSLPLEVLPSQNSQVRRSINCLPAAVDTELLVDIDRVSFDCFGRDENLLSDLFVTHPLCQKEVISSDLKRILSGDYPYLNLTWTEGRGGRSGKMSNFMRLLPKTGYAPSFEGDDAFSSIPRLPAWSFQRVTDG